MKHELSERRQIDPIVIPQEVTQELIADWYDSLKPDTKRAYKKGLAVFADFIGVENDADAAETLIRSGHGAANAIAMKWRSSMKKEGLKPSTINRRIAALRSVIKLANRIGMCSWTLDVRHFKAEPYKDTRGPGLDGALLMWDALMDRPETPKAVRDRAIFRLLWDLGLRRGEVAKLTMADYRPTASTLHVLGKGRDEKIAISLPEETQEELEKWLEVRGREPGPLFTTTDRATKGTGLSGWGIWLMIRDLGREVGLDREMSPHKIRHAAITALLDATGGDVRQVSRFSRHANISTLMRYDDNRRNDALKIREIGAGLLDRKKTQEAQK